MGLSSSLRVLIVCHCYREEGNGIRIISAWKATAKEAKFYPQRWQYAQGIRFFGGDLYLLECAASHRKLNLNWK